jgi:hypothetical protein
MFPVSIQNLTWMPHILDVTRPGTERSGWPRYHASEVESLQWLYGTPRIQRVKQVTIERSKDQIDLW